MQNRWRLNSCCTAKLASFTLTEVLVVLLLTGIVFMAAAMAFSNISRIVTKNMAEKRQQQATLLFLMRLRDDITTSDYITGEADTFTMHMRADSILRTYSFTPYRIAIAQAGVTDTVNIRTQNLKFDFEAPKLIKSVAFEFYADSAMHQFYFKKEYAADFLFNNIVLENRQWE